MAIIFALSLTPLGFAQEISTTQLTYGDIEPYTGMFGPSSRLYKFKLMLEGLDETLTFDPVNKLEKKLKHAHKRLAEVKGELLKNRQGVAEQTMARYALKMAETEQELAVACKDATEETKQKLEQIQIRAEVHRLALGELIVKNPDASGLKTALENAVQNAERLENRFEFRLNKRINSTLMSN